MRGTVEDRINAWDIAATDPEVAAIAEAAARSIANQYQGVIEADDLEQEALILIATKRQLSELALNVEYGLLYSALKQDLLDKFVRPLLRSGEMNARRYRTATPEDAEDDSTVYEPMFDNGSGDYNVQAVEFLLPAVWDESYAYGLPRRGNEPDADMPKSAGNKAHGNNHWAYIADIKQAWKRTPLTLGERRSLLMVFGMGLTLEDTAQREGVAKSSVHRRVESGKHKLGAFLNKSTAIGAGA